MEIITKKQQKRICLKNLYRIREWETRNLGVHTLFDEYVESKSPLTFSEWKLNRVIH